MRRFLSEHPEHPLNSALLWTRIRAIVNLTMLSIAPSITDNGGCFELLGFDVMIDEQFKPWLLEVNCPIDGAPCPIDGAPCPIDGAPCPIDGAPCPIDGAPCPIDGAHRPNYGEP